jgi:5-methyltetrahydropteroyltriglutamate--homocysteine methyltransferase
MAKIKTTTVGSYSPIDWLAALPSEQAVLDATQVVISTQRNAGIDLPTDGELYRFDVDHPDTNGMIEYFISRLGGIDTKVGISDGKAFRAKQEMGFRRKPAGVVRGPIGEGSLDLFEACTQSASVAGGPIKFTLTSPYMLARTLLVKRRGHSVILAIIRR